MRVLFWSTFFWPYIGGIEVLSSRLLPALMEHGHEFIVVSQGGTGFPTEYEFQGNTIPIYRYPMTVALNNRDIKKIKEIRNNIAEIKSTYKPHLVHINTSGPGLFFHQKTKNVLTSNDLFSIHFFPEAKIEKNSLIVSCLKSSNWVSAVSQAMLEDARKIVPEIENKSSLIYNGLPMPSIKPANYQFDEPILLCIGRLVPEKGFDLALEAFAYVHKVFPRARLLIAGDGICMADLKSQAKSLNIQEFVDFSGWIDPDKIMDLINQAVLVIVPSRWREPFGLIALQASQMARPVVASNVGGLPEVVVHTKTGFLYKNEDITELANYLIILLKNPDKAQQMGKEGRARAKSQFSIQRCVDSYNSLYNQIMLKQQ
jgi:glycogen(starch) synthase